MPFVYAGQFTEGFTDRYGNAQPNLPVTVYLPNTYTKANLYADRDKNAALANPVATDGVGNLDIYAEPGPYDFVADGVTYRRTVPVDPEEAGRYFPTVQPVSGTLALDAATIAALQQVVAAFEPGEALALDAPTIAALQAVTATVSGSVAVTNLPATQAVSVDSLPLPTGAATATKQDDALAVLQDVKRSVNDYRTLLDYDVRTDGNPVYVGTNAQAAAEADATWTVMRLTYDASNRLTDKQVLTGSWTGRAGLAWV